MGPVKWCSGMVGVLACAIFALALLARAATEPATRPALLVQSAVETPEKHIKLTWKLDAAAAPGVTGFIVDRAEITATKFVAVSPRLAVTAGEYVDSGPFVDGHVYVYQVRALSAKGVVCTSPPQPLSYVNVPPPPAPRNVKAEFVKVRGESYIRLTWDPKAKEDALTDHYLIYTDKVQAGVMTQETGILKPIQGHECLLPVGGDSDRTWTVGVAAVSQRIAISAHTDTTCLVPGRYIPGVEKLTAEKGEAGTVLLKWNYPEGVRIQGFRIREGEKVLAEPAQVGATAREYRLKDMAGQGHKFAVEPVSSTGAQPKIDASVNYSPVKFNAAFPGKVYDVAAKWVEVEGKKQIHLEWKVDQVIPGQSYEIQADFELPKAIQPVKLDKVLTETQCNLVPPDEKRSYTFWVQSASPAGDTGALGVGKILGVGKSLWEPEFKGDLTAIKQGTQTAVKLEWTYETVPQLKGFRMYVDGKVAANEETLGKDARVWTSGPLPRGSHKFQLEAVATDGSTSDRTPKAGYSVR